MVGNDYSDSVDSMDYPARHVVSAAAGWLELANHREALAELETLPAEARAHPESLDIEWKAHAGLRQWEPALVVAERLIERSPDEVAGWIHRSYCLHELRRTREAMELLSPAYTRFQRDFVVPYNLACYACQLGDLAGAKTWLERACRQGNARTIKRMAMQDSDLAAIHPEIGEL